MGKLVVENLALEAPETWIFFPMGEMIITRRDAGTGSLQITRTYRNELRNTGSPSAFLAVAREFNKREGVSEPFDIVQVAETDSLFGGFSYTAADDFGRVWYRLVDDQLVLGAYGCSRRQQNSPDIVTEMAECEQIMRSARYASSVQR